MIPGIMRDFLARASVAVASTRDDDLVPHLHFLSGWSVGPDQGSVVCLLPAAFCDGLLDRLARHGEMAVTAEVIGPHECYQFKGRYLDHRPAEASDRPTFEACRERFVDAVARLLPGRFGDDALRARFRDPALAVRFGVREIFLQTPGPGAGRRLYPPEE